MKKNLIHNVVKKLNVIAESSFGTTSVLYLNQPKEPEALKKLLKTAKN